MIRDDAWPAADSAEALLDLLPVPLAIGPADADSVIYANAAALALFEIGADALARMRVPDFYVDDAQRHDFVRRLHAGGQVEGLEAEFRTARGRSFPALVTARLARRGGRMVAIVAFQDITARRFAERETARLARDLLGMTGTLEQRVLERTRDLAATHALLDSTLASVDQAVAVYGADGVLRFCNRRHEEVLELPPECSRPGETRMRDVLRAMAARGDYGPGDPDEIAARHEARIRAGRVPRGERRLPSGRWILSLRTHAPDGTIVVTVTDITALKQVEAELAASRDEADRARRRLEDAIEAIPQGFVVYDNQDRIALFNARYRDQYSLVPDLIRVGTGFEAIVRAAAARGAVHVPPGGLEPWVAERVRQHRAGTRALVSRRRGRWVQVTESRTPAGEVVVIYADVTDLKQRQRELRDSRRLLRGVIDAVPALVNVKDRDGRYVLMNRFQGQVYGVDPAAAIGRTSPDIVGRDYGGRSREMDLEVVRTGAALPWTEREFVDAAGTRRVWFTAKLPLKDERGRTDHVVTVALDISRLKAVERARANLARHFAPSMVEELAHADEPFGPAREQEIAVLFVDIVGFTAFAASTPAERVFALLRMVHARLAGAVFDHGGTLDKFTGDGLMATFGTPRAGARDAASALACARAIAAAMRAALSGPDGAQGLRACVGVHCGKALLGTIGDERRLEFAVIGDTVNVANRLEALAHGLGVDVAASAAVIARAAAEGAPIADFVDRGSQALRGRPEPVTVWTLSL